MHVFWEMMTWQLKLFWNIDLLHLGFKGVTKSANALRVVEKLQIKDIEPLPDMDNFVEW